MPIATQTASQYRNLSLRLTSMLLAVTLGLSACAHENQVRYTYVGASSANTVHSDRAAQLQLAQAANSVSQSLQTLSKVQQAANPNLSLGSYDQFNGIHFARRATLNWSGPVEQPLQSIASAIHYKVYVLGTAPAVPALVDVHQHNQPIASIIRNMNYQLTVNHSGSIMVYPKRKILELRYLD